MKNLMILMFSITLIIPIILMVVNSHISKKTFIDREKSSPFECGFDPKSSARLPFSLRFFLIALVFLIFDVEITLILPMPLSLGLMFNSNIFLLISFFIFILIIGLFHEWNEGALEWQT